MTRKTKVGKKKIKAYADIGRHGGIFMFGGGFIADKYPTLLHVYKDQITRDLKPVVITYVLGKRK